MRAWVGPLRAYVGRPMVDLAQPILPNLTSRPMGQDVEAQPILPIVDKISQAYYSIRLDIIAGSIHHVNYR